MKTILHSLNKAFLKVKPSRQEINQFKQNLQELYIQINTNLSETEEYHKNNLSNFFKQTYYHPNYYINTKESHDLVIHNGKNAQSSVGVIIEAKSPTNTQEMINKQKFNSKSLQQLLFYYLQERVINKNLELKHLIITNSLDFYVFPATLFEKLFYQEKKLIKLFDDFNNKLLSSSNRNFFYQEIAKPAINQVENELKDNCIHFTLNNFYKKEDEKELIVLYKFFSPQHLLKQPFANDSNSLDQGFYSELLHIIGLAEVKQGSKKIIQRLPENQRHSASLLENTINQLDISEKVHYLQNPEEYGENYQQRLFNIALELVITWVNRILFLKLLEAQLIRYNSPVSLVEELGARVDFNFLNSKIITNFNELECLFFQVLAKQYHERKADIQAKFNHIPYLNSSLFEVTVIERQTIGISSLNYHTELDLYAHTVLKDSQGKPLTQPQKTLDYLFNFLSAYDFSSEGSLEIQEDNKTLINASVLGLIFEKINGYQDGSYFTPGFITMYMCRETIRRAIVDKFNQIKGWNCQTIDDLYDKIEDKQEANQIINSIKICDPAVGSGHFLVSALNEIIALKSELNILLDRQGKTIKKTDYFVTVENDELIVTDEDNKPFAYNPNNRESRRIQEALFHEKQVIIENCLFGVDININSVKICRLRLWIELLKNAYYIIPNVISSQENLIPPNPPSKGGEIPLQTLPNIDINIKCGNSLISRFDLKDSISSPKVKRQIAEYKEAVKAYRNPESKQEKLRVEKVINEIKASLSSEITGVDAISTRLRQLEGELNGLVNQTSLFAETAKEKKAREKKQQQLEKEINKLRLEREDKRDNRIYQNGFEWRFEFPEILDDNGDFLGFDIIIGNPPYGVKLSKEEKQYLQNKFTNQDYQLDTYLLFMEQGLILLKNNGEFSYIIPNTWLFNLKYKKIRKFLIEKTKINTIAHYKKAVFQDATVDTQSLLLSKQNFDNQNQRIEIRIYNNQEEFIVNEQNQLDWHKLQGDTVNIFLSKELLNLKTKISENCLNLGDLFNVVVGLKPYEKGKGKPPQTKLDVEKRIYDADYKIDSSYKKLLRGSDINKYSNNWQGDRWLKYGNNLAAPRYSANFNADEKIIVRQTGDTLIATIDTEKFICMNNLHVITYDKQKNNFNLSFKYILALINSQLLDYYHYMMNPEKGEALAEVKKENLEKLPIKIISEEEEKPFIEIVEKILEKKRENPEADTKELERNIDEMVYKLYELTAEEIAIVEGDL
ncbi:DUF7149 domain-containing protein [Cyanobacterium sp. DS4]|uniref:type IIG restriction enzyme/methyltransferase n=1 Tax=Cyanobacterium sp. DS4 TaxID=2878255 RepID=UPI002E81C280|nr:TaqI-like C-terminal specificity domain-containing protein [Cyanobacterium sp. Dongsha4]WVK99727.1 N-6 DNA methylase [Cyanobacterium sp. Dongsha4]